jgi:hypothetical protein
VAIIKKAGNRQISDKELYELKIWPKKVTEALGGAGLLELNFPC